MPKITIRSQGKGKPRYAGSPDSIPTVGHIRGKTEKTIKTKSGRKGGAGKSY